MAVEAFGPAGFAKGDEEVFRRLVFRDPDTLGWGRIKSSTGTRPMGLDGNKFSREALELWLTELRIRSYSPGLGVWTTAEIHVFPNKPGNLEVFEEEHLQKMSNGRWYPGAAPAVAADWARQLLAFPRTVDTIPSWMWDIFRSDGVTPPIYNPEFASVDWNNRRRPVTERGTDFTVEPTVIDPSLEPGVFAKISKKLFGA